MTENTKTLYQLYLHQTRVNGGSPAFFTPEQTYTYAAFLGMVDTIAAGMHERGVEKGDRVCTMALNSMAHYAVIIACSKLGAIAFPINWRLTPDEVSKILKLAEPKMFIAEKAFLPIVEGVDSNILGTRVLLGEGTVENFIPFSEIRSAEISPPVELTSDDPAIIISTAAVAGDPRGAVITHGNMEAAVDAMVDKYKLTDQDRYLADLPFFHITGIQIMFGMAAAGGACAVPPKFEPAVETQWIDQHQITLICTFPPMLEGLMTAKDELGSHWNSLKWCIGILNPPEIIKTFIGLGVGEYWIAYGQTETTGAVSLMNVTEKPGSIGKPLSAIEVRIVDEGNKDLPTGEVGEIVIQGPLVFAGYWNDEPATLFASRYGWHHTGDLGKFDDEGYLYYAGRRPEKDLIKSGGENIYPAEVEYAIRSIPQVAEVCVIGVIDDEWGESVKAVIELKMDGSMTDSEIVQELEGKIASYKKPRFIEFVDMIPRLGTGHIDRELLKKEFGTAN